MKSSCGWLYTVLHTCDCFPGREACHTDGSQKTEGLQQAIVMNHYFYSLYMPIIYSPFIFICHIHTYIYDRLQRYSAMYHNHIFIYSPLQESSYLLQKKITLIWWQNYSKTIPTRWQTSHTCSCVLYSYPAAFYICRSVCAYTYIYAHVFLVKGIPFQYGDAIFKSSHSYKKRVLILTAVTKYQLSQQFPAFINYSWSVSTHCSYSSTEKILFLWAYHLTFSSFWRHTSLIK